MSTRCSPLDCSISAVSDWPIVPANEEVSGRLPLELTHPWEVSPKEAIAIQQQLRVLVRSTDELGTVSLVAGVDVGFEDAGRTTRAAVVVLDYPELRLRDQVLARRPTGFPYVPGLLSFREIPAILDALEQLTTIPDLLLCDGQGYAHPRRFGLACHLGVLTGIPSIGVAKSRFIGEHPEPPETKGGWVELRHSGECIGAVVRSRSRVKPLYVSVGHKVCLGTAVEYVLSCTPRYRLPETTRIAHRLASQK